MNGPTKALITSMSNFFSTGPDSIILKMDVSKIQLSLAEEELVQNAEIILTKNSVLQKTKSLLEKLHEDQLLFVKLNDLESHELFRTGGKVSKGENYLGLPYMILDYPRRSSGKDLFFIRTMFWWGNYFSSTLHLSGHYKHLYLLNITRSLSSLGDHYIGVNEDQWIHHFETDNYRQLKQLSEKEVNSICRSFDHLKIGMTTVLSQWREAPQLLLENWKLLLNTCGLITNTV
jgi:hypothetical protein